MINKEILIAALARNCEKSLSDNIKRINQLRSHFQQSEVVVYENNSKDSTKQILKQWKEESERILIVSEDLQEDKYNPAIMDFGHSYLRIEKMSRCRNKLLGIIKDHFSPNIILFLDIDVHSFSVEGIVLGIKNAPSNWGGLFANCSMSQISKGEKKEIPFYYDTYAFLPNGKDYKDLHNKPSNRLTRLFQGFRIYKTIQQSAYTECSSAFGGIGIYKYEYIRDLSYRTYPSGTKEQSICEHIPFNLDLKQKGASLFISRDVRVCYSEVYKNGIKAFAIKHMPRLYMFITETITMIHEIKDA